MKFILFLLSAVAFAQGPPITINQTQVQGGIANDCLKVNSNKTLGQATCGGGGSGTVTSVSGTANEISVATGTSTPVVSVAASFDISGHTSTAPIKKGTSLPATCTVGQFYNKTDATASAVLYACTATNTWTAQGGGASPAGSAVTDAQCWASATTFGVCTSPAFTSPTVTTQSAGDNSTKAASTAFVHAVAIKALGGAFTNSGSAIVNNTISLPVPPTTAACTIVAWSLSIPKADTGTATVKFLKVAAGTASPGTGDEINTNGVALSTGTHVRSTTVTDFTTVAVASGDIIAVKITAVTGSPTGLTANVECAQ